MNILITGASGFIGGHLVKDYSNYKDTKIVALGRDFKHNNNPPNVMYVSVDLLDSVQLETALEGIEVDIIIHSAGQAHISNSTSNQKLFIDNNIKVTENVLAISKIKNVKKIVFISSVAALNLDPQDYYGNSKKNAEELILEFCSKNSINFIVIRPVMVYGENDIKGNMYKLIKQIHKGFFPLLNKGKTRKSTIYVKNLTSIIIEVCQSEKYNGKFIIAADSDVLTMKNICFFIREHLNTKCFFVYLPKFTVHILVFMIGLLQQLGLVKGMNSGSLEKLVIDTVYEIDEHSDELIKNVPFTTEQGLARTVNWYKKFFLEG